MLFSPKEKGQGLIEIIILISLIGWGFLALLKLGKCANQPFNVLKLFEFWNSQCK